MDAVTSLDELYRVYLAACNDHDMAAVGRLVAPSVLVNGAELDRDDFVRDLERLCESFPDHQWEALRQIVAEQWLTVVLRTTGQQAGGWRGLAPTGRHVSGREIDVYRFEDGLIREVWTVGDDLARFLELSAEP